MTIYRYKATTMFHSKIGIPSISRFECIVHISICRSKYICSLGSCYIDSFMLTMECLIIISIMEIWCYSATRYRPIKNIWCSFSNFTICQFPFISKKLSNSRTFNKLSICFLCICTVIFCKEWIIWFYIFITCCLP